MLFTFSLPLLLKFVKYHFKYRHLLPSSHPLQHNANDSNFPFLTFHNPGSPNLISNTIPSTHRPPAKHKDHKQRKHLPVLQPQHHVLPKTIIHHRPPCHAPSWLRGFVACFPRALTRSPGSSFFSQPRGHGAIKPKTMASEPLRGGAHGHWPRAGRPCRVARVGRALISLGSYFRA
jgi:hypothetical protein